MTDSVVTPDGRRLAVEQAGDPRGMPIFLLHGTPGCRLGPRPRAAVLYRLGVRLITFDRPGYGESDRLPNRRVADAASDVAAIADAYELERFAVMGRSGGSPHALACAALLPDRTTRAAALVSLAPPDARELDWFTGMGQSNVREFVAATANRSQVAQRLTILADQIRADPARLVSGLQADLTDPDRKIINDIGLRSMLLASYAEALRLSPYGWIDDILALCAPWKFSLTDVTAPVLIWHGEDDRFSPIAHARWLAKKIPNTTMIVESGAAHFGALDILPDVLQWLACESGDAGTQIG